MDSRDAACATENLSEANQDTQLAVELGWDDISSLMGELREVARAFLRQEGHRGSIKTTGLVLTALRRQKKSNQDWEEITWENRHAFFGRVYRAMRHALIDYARKRARRREIRAGDLSTEFTASLAEAGMLDLRNLEYFVTSEKRTEVLDSVLDELDEVHPNLHLSLIAQYYAFSDLTQQEIADMFEVNERTIRRRLALIRAVIEHSFEKNKPL